MKKKSHRYYIYHENTGKIVGDSSSLYCEYRPSPKKFVETVQTPLQGVAQHHQKKQHRPLEQCLGKANRAKHNEVSIHLYSINPFYLIKE